MSMKPLNALLMLCAWASQSVSAQPAAILTMDVTPRVTDDHSDVILNFRLRSGLTEQLTIERGSWFDGDNVLPIRIAAEEFPDFNAKPFVACPAPLERITIDDPSPGSVNLPSHAELKGQLELHKRYRNLNAIIGKCDLVLTWTYRPYFENGAIASRMTGVIVIPASLGPLSTSTASASIATK